MEPERKTRRSMCQSQIRAETETHSKSVSPSTGQQNLAMSEFQISDVAGSSSPSITDMTQDHLFSILLELPADSILSFGMTCKRAKSLTDSDTLWESICRRDWGHASVDALISSSSSNSNHLLWKNLYGQVRRLDRVSCRTLSSSDGNPGITYPRPRASHSLNYVSDSLLLFGGGSEGGCHLDDTWAAYIGNNFRRILGWQKIVVGCPSGRFGHSCIVLGDYLVLFGGINDRGIRQNDTWVGQVSIDETFSVTLSWRLLDVGLVAPPARGAHAGCSIDNTRMLIHGGIGLSGLRLGDSWILDVSETLFSGTWREIVTHPLPPARSGHTLTCIGGSQTVLFGGRGVGYEVLYDVWLFDASDGQLRWVQVPYELRNVPGGLSIPRVGHSATLVLGGRLLIYGGEDSYRHRKNDFWLLDVKSRSSSVRTQHTNVNQRVVLPKMWRRLESEGYQPKCRSFHRACADRSGHYLYVFGGMVDGVVHAAEASGLRFDGELFVAELVI